MRTNLSEGGVVRTWILCSMSVFVVLATAVGLNAQDCDWKWVNPTPPRADIYRLKQEINAFVGVGAAGTIIRSSDGFSWDLIESGVSGDLFGIDWGAGAFVAVGDGAVLRSVAGNDWTIVLTDSQARLVDVEFSASRFVAIGEGLDGHVLTSRLGTQWESVPVPWAGIADSITGSNDGFYVAVGTGIWFSADGFDWVFEDSAPASQAFLSERSLTKSTGSDLFELDRIDLAWTGTRLLWSGGSELWAREEVGEWDLVSTLGGCPPWSDWLGVVGGPGWALASGISGCPTPFLDPTVSLTISVDGGQSFGDPWEVELGGFPALARYGSRWIAAGALGDVMTSTNGSSWECRNGGCSSLACEDGFSDLTAGENRWAAVGGVGLCDGGLKRRSGGTSATSYDGEQWEIHPLGAQRFRGVTQAGLQYVGVGDGWIGRSADGVEWTIDGSPEGAVLRSVAAGGGSVVTVGNQGGLYVSDDGATWFKPFSYVTADLDRVVWIGDQFIAMGRGGSILRSTDTLNWNEALTNVTVDLKGAAAGPEGKIMVGQEGAILASDGGEVWISRRSGVDSSLEDVTWADERFVAVGWDEQADGSRPAVVLASRDGRDWTRLSAPGGELKRVRWTGSSWLVVGGDRTIMTADCIGTLIDFEDEHLRVPHEEIVDLVVHLSEDVATDTPVTVSSSMPTDVVVPQTVTVLAGADTVFVPVTGASVVANVVLTLSLPDHLGGGSATVLVSVEPPEGRPRTPAGRVRP
jgi:hypothetical protein